MKFCAQAEARDATARLAPEVLAVISTAPKALNFGTVCVRSATAKSFFVTNDTPGSILVAIDAARFPELAQSTPAAQLIPAGATAGFDIIFSAASACDFAEAVGYTVNGHHPARFHVVGCAVPISVDVSTAAGSGRDAALTYRFPKESTAPDVSDVVSLKNTGNAAAEFKWELPPGCAFRLSPEAGSIPPFGSLTCTATFVPTVGVANEAFAALRVVGGAPGDARGLRLAGECEEPKVSFVEKKVDFGAQAVGLARERSITLRTASDVDAVFWFEGLPPGVSVVPLRGRVPGGGESVDVAVTFEPMGPVVLDERRAALTCCVRGARALRLPLSATATVPDAVIQQTAFDFGVVAIGASHRLRVTIENRGLIPAVLFVDLSKHPMFALAAAQSAGDDGHSVGDESVLVPVDVAESLDDGTADPNAVPTKFKLQVRHRAWRYAFQNTPRMST